MFHHASRFFCGAQVRILGARHLAEVAALVTRPQGFTPAIATAKPESCME
jgi:hypothetical protein